MDEYLFQRAELITDSRRDRILIEQLFDPKSDSYAVLDEHHKHLQLIQYDKDSLLIAKRLQMAKWLSRECPLLAL